MPTKKEITGSPGDWIKMMRGNLSKEEFARKLGISVRQYYRYENDEVVIPEPIQKLANQVYRNEALSSGQVAEPKPDFAAGLGYTPDFEKSMGVEKGSEAWKALGLLHEIVSDEDPTYSRAIMANLHAFSAAIHERRKRAELEERLDQFQQKQKTDEMEILRLREGLRDVQKKMETHTMIHKFSGDERRAGADRRRVEGTSPTGSERRSGEDRREEKNNNGVSL